MTTQNDALSALMDGELSELELRRLLKASATDAEVAAKWQRYHLVRDVMHQQVPCKSMDLAQRVSVALDDTPSIPQHPDEPDHLRLPRHVSLVSSLASMAVAASVTAVVILGAGWYQQDTSVGSAALAQAPANLSLPNTANSRHQYAQLTSLGQLPSGYSSFAADADVIRMSDDLSHYIQQHRHLLAEQAQPGWEIAWVPQGYAKVRHDFTQTGEVVVFSNGRSHFSVSVEALGPKHAAEGISYQGDLIALGRVQDESFVAVVGEMPLMVAERIAASVVSVR